MRLATRFVAIAATLLMGHPAALRAQGASDALILVHPQGDRAMVVVTYATRVGDTEARGRMARLAAAGRWQIDAMSVAERRFRSAAGASRAPVAAHTSSTALLSRAPQVRGGGFALQPYAIAFGDMARWEVLFLVPPRADLRPLRRYETPALSLALVSEGNPYRYLVVRGQADAPITLIPDSDPLAPSGSSAVVTSSPWTGLRSVMLAALACGIVVFLALMLRLRRG